MKQIRVLLIEDHFLARMALHSQLLHFQDEKGGFHTITTKSMGDVMHRFYFAECRRSDICPISGGGRLMTEASKETGYDI